jgi:hypothetical protein
LKTLGSGWVSLLGLPSPPMMVTVGRLVIVAAVLSMSLTLRSSRGAVEIWT